MNRSNIHPISKPTDRVRLDQIQFLRFLAFFCVYVAHAEVWLFFPFPSAHCSTSAVGFFFILSGFLTGFTAINKNLHLNIREYAGGIWKHIRKLYPLYFLTMLLPVFSSNLLTCFVAGSIPGEGIQLMKNLLMIQSWFPEGSMSFNGVGWYISTTMFLYLFTLPVTYLLNKVKNRPHCLFLFTGLLSGVLFMTAVYCYLTKSLYLGFWHYVFPPARLGEYLGGILLGYIIATVKPKIHLSKWSATILELGTLVFSFCAMYHFGSPWRVHILNWLIPNMLLISVFALGQGYISDLFRWKPLVHLGDISFECFLIHNLLIVRVAQFNSQLADTPAGKMVGFLSVLAFSIILSLYLHKPAPKRLKSV